MPALMNLLVDFIMKVAPQVSQVNPAPRPLVAVAVELSSTAAVDTVWTTLPIPSTPRLHLRKPLWIRICQSHLGKSKWNPMTIKAIEGGSLCPLFYVPFLKKSFEKKPKCISRSARYKLICITASM